MEVTRIEYQTRPIVLTLENLLSVEHCQKLLDNSEQEHEYSQAQITVGHNQYRTDTSIRNNDRIILDDEKLADELFAIIKEHLPPTFNNVWQLKGLNERFRYYRYGKGQRFAPHFDGPFERNQYEKSFLTLIFYLNEDFLGGATTFLHHHGAMRHVKPKYVIAPKIGSALVFYHKQLHEGSEVTEGVKYVLRTDVMYHIPNAE